MQAFLDDNVLYQATLLPNRKRFLAYLRTKSIGDRRLTGRGTVARMLFSNLGPWESGRIVAEMVFYTEQFDANSVAHETAHMVLAFVSTQGGKPKGSDVLEEKIATMIGDVTGRVLDWKDHLDELPPHVLYRIEKQST